MAIKASGTALTAMSESAGWVEVNIAAVLSIFDRKELATLETDTREARVLQHFFSAVVGGTGRPSVETALHAMLGKFVIHTHPVAANALNCGPGQRPWRRSPPRVNSRRSGCRTPIPVGAWLIPSSRRLRLIDMRMAACPWFSSWKIMACWSPLRRRKPAWRSMRNG